MKTDPRKKGTDIQRDLSGIDKSIKYLRENGNRETQGFANIYEHTENIEPAATKEFVRQELKPFSRDMKWIMGILGSIVAIMFYLHRDTKQEMNRQFAEQKQEMNRQFAEQKQEMNRQFAEQKQELRLIRR